MAKNDKFNLMQYHVTILKSDNTPTSAAQIATNVTFPPLIMAFDTDARSALPGAVPYPLAFQPQELTVSMKGLTQEFWEELYKNFKKLVTVKIEGAGCHYDTFATENIDLTCKGFISQYPGMNYQAQQNATSEWKMMINEFSWLIGLSTAVAADKTEILYRPREFKLLVNGVNVLAADAAAIGIVIPA